MINDTQAIVLRLLIGTEQSGSELMELSKVYNAFFNVTRSQVYRELNILDASGLVEMVDAGSRGSFYYTATAEGEQAYEEWLKASSGPVKIRDKAALRVALGSSLALRQLTSVYERAQADANRINKVFS